jgi:hypothetical protein
MSLIHPIKLNQLLHQINHAGLVVSLGIRRRIIDFCSQHVVEHHPEPRHKHAYARPAADMQPVVDDEAAAHGVEGYTAAEEEERIRIECCEGLLVFKRNKRGREGGTVNVRVKSRIKTLLVSILAQ